MYQALERFFTVHAYRFFGCITRFAFSTLSFFRKFQRDLNERNFLVRIVTGFYLPHQFYYLSRFNLYIVGYTLLRLSTVFN